MVVMQKRNKTKKDCPHQLDLHSEAFVGEIEITWYTKFILKYSGRNKWEWIGETTLANMVIEIAWWRHIDRSSLYYFFYFCICLKFSVIKTKNKNKNKTPPSIENSLSAHISHVLFTVKKDNALFQSCSETISASETPSPCRFACSQGLSWMWGPWAILG